VNLGVYAMQVDTDKIKRQKILPKELQPVNRPLKIFIPFMDADSKLNFIPYTSAKAILEKYKLSAACLKFEF
jgi:hypothetical protein